MKKQLDGSKSANEVVVDMKLSITRKMVPITGRASS